MGSFNWQMIRPSSIFQSCGCYRVPSHIFSGFTIYSLHLESCLPLLNSTEQNSETVSVSLLDAKTVSVIYRYLESTIALRGSSGRGSCNPSALVE